MDAARHLFHRNQRTNILAQDDALLFGVARGRHAIADRQVLQLAFAALVADRAIERVVDEQELHHRLLRLDRLGALGPHDHALRHRGRAGRHRLGHLLHVNQAHAAIGRNAELLVITKMRNISARLVGRMHDHAAFDDFDLLAVEFDFYHLLLPVQTTIRRAAASMVRRSGLSPAAPGMPAQCAPGGSDERGGLVKHMPGPCRSCVRRGIRIRGGSA